MSASDAWRILERFKDAEGVWVRYEPAYRYVGCCDKTLSEWTNDGCPHLGGRRLRTKPREVFGRPANYYLLAELNEIKKNRQTPSRIMLKKGQRFGNFSVIRLSNRRDKWRRRNGKRGARLWELRCKCGRVVYLPYSSFTRAKGAAKSCGRCGLGKTLVFKKGVKLNWLVYIGPTKKRRGGSRLHRWRCVRPDPSKPNGICGKIALVTGKAVKRGTTKSCSCLKLAGDVSHLPTPSEVRRRYKQREKIVDEGWVWLSLKAAMRFMKVSYGTILNLAKNDKVETRPFVHGMGQEIPYYLQGKEDGGKSEGRSTLQGIKESLEALDVVPNVPGFTYCEIVATLLGIHLRTLRKKLDRMGAKMKKVTAKGKDGQKRRRAYVPNWSCLKLGIKLIEPSNGTQEQAEVKPQWDADAMELWLGARLVKRFSRLPVMQGKILSAFQEEDWPARIDDPLPLHSLRTTLSNMRIAFHDSPIKFTADGTGEGVRWLVKNRDSHRKNAK